MDPQVYARMAANEDEHWWFVARRRILTDVIRRRIAPAPGCQILEAGCGTGGNLAMLGQFGQISAFELDAGARRVATEKSAVDVREGRLPDRVPFESDRFDLVAMLDVLEHVDDDVGGLGALGRVLRHGGRLLLTVPAYSFLWSRHDDQHHHKRRYDRKGLIRSVRAADLEPLYVSYFNTLLFPVVAGVRLAGKLLGGRDDDDDAMPSPLLNRLLAGAFAAERHVVPRRALPFGVSLLMIARRA